MSERRRSNFSQFSLLTLLLLIAVAAIWLACYRASQDARQTRQELLSLREVARELNVDDRDQFAVVRKHPTWHDEHRFAIWVPDRRDMDAAILLQVENVDSHGFGTPVAVSPLPPGRHEIELILEGDENEGWEVIVLRNGETVIRKALAADWNAGRGYRGGASVSTLIQRQKMPIVLDRRKFMVPRGNGFARSPSTPGNGLLLWIGPQPQVTDQAETAVESVDANPPSKPTP